MTANDKCERRRLAECGTFKIDMCDCGTVHLTIGCLTLRFEPSAYGELATAIDESLRRLQRPDKPVIQ
jgi:hypothetical protein